MIRKPVRFMFWSYYILDQILDSHPGSEFAIKQEFVESIIGWIDALESTWSGQRI